MGSHYVPFLTPAALLIVLMIGLRFQVGADWPSYERIYEYYRYADLNETLAFGDPGFSILNWLGQRFGAGIWFVNLTCAAVFTWGLLRFAREQPNPWLTILVGIPYLVIVVAMGYTRQAVAIGFILAGLAKIDRSSILSFAAYVLLAVLFHKSAVVILPLVALAAARQRLTTGLLLLMLMAALYYVFVAGSVDRMLTNYVEAELSSQGAAIRVAMNLPPAILYLVYQARFALSPMQRKLWRNFSFAAFACLGLLLYIESSTAVDRLALYIIPLQLFVLSRLPEVFPDKGRANAQLLLAVIAYSALIQFVWLTYASHAQYWLPYQTVVLPHEEQMDGSI